MRENSPKPTSPKDLALRFLWTGQKIQAALPHGRRGKGMQRPGATVNDEQRNEYGIYSHERSLSEIQIILRNLFGSFKQLFSLRK